eukprot:COSAG02_NODE_215_length_28614_cov_43.077047_7_plen_1563_part_00
MDSLLAMGFSRHDSAGALAEAADDVRRAIDMLLDGYEAPPAPATEEPAEEEPARLAGGGPPEGDPGASHRLIVALESTEGACPEPMLPRGGVASTLSVSEGAEFRMPVPGGAATASWSIDETNRRQVDVAVLFLPEGAHLADPSRVAYVRYVSCYGSYSTDQPGTLLLRLSNQFSWRSSKTVNVRLSVSPGAGASPEQQDSQAAIQDLGLKLTDATQDVVQLKATNGELQARLASTPQAPADLLAELQQLRAQVASIPHQAAVPMAAHSGTVHELLQEHGLTEFEERLLALGATSTVHLSQLDQTDFSALGVTEAQRAAFESMLLRCEQPAVIEDSLERVSSAAEKRSQRVAEELRRQRSNGVNPSGAAAQMAPDDSDILTRVNTLQIMASRQDPQPSDGEQDCSICMETFESSQGVKCGGDDSHYVCLSCLCLYIQSQCEPAAAGGTYEIAKRNANGDTSQVGELPCPVFLMDGCGCGCIGGDEPSLMIKVASHPASFRTLKSLIGASQRAALELAREEQAQAAEAERKRKAEQTALQAATELVVEAMTKGQATDCPKCNATFRKDEACMHMKCEICRTDFCYVCGQDTTKCVRGRDCDRISCYLESNPGWNGFARDSESAGEGALYEFQRRKIAFMVREAKAKIPADIWQNIMTENPELFQDVLRGRSITLEEVDAAESLPQFGARHTGPPGQPDETGFAAGMRVRLTEDAAELERSADGFGGWNPAMAACCGKIGVVEHTNGTWVSVGFGRRSWALNPAVLTRVADDAEADEMPDGDDDEADLLRMLMRDLGGGPAVPRARGPVRRRRRAGDGAASGAISVGDRVALRPGVEQRGPLAHGRVGTLVEDDGSSVPYKCEFEGETHWYTATDVVAADTAGAGAGGGALERGDRVRVISDRDRARALADGFGGWNGDMAEYCGTEGTVQEVNRSGSVRVRHEDGRMWAWNPEALESLAGSGVARRPATGDRVILAPGESEGCLSGTTVGTVVVDDGSRVPFQVRAPDGATYWYRAEQVVLAEAAAPDQLREGDSVTVLPSVDRVRELADGHGGWASSMAEYCGQTGIVRNIDSDGDVSVKFPDGNSWTYNPAALVGGGGSHAKRPTVGDHVRIRRGTTTHGLQAGEVYVIHRDDHDANPYRLRSNTPGDEESYGFFAEGDVELVEGARAEEGRPITHHYLPVGTRVVRGPDWEWGDQDGGAGGTGTIVEHESDRWTQVTWDRTGRTASYKNGMDRRLDLQEVGGTAAPRGTAFTVSGSGKSRCNGPYRQEGSNDGKPMYKQVGGSGLIYFSSFWKLNDETNTHGWYYSVRGSTGDEPPTGQWTTHGYSGSDADPPPTVTRVEQQVGETTSQPDGHWLTCPGSGHQAHPMARDVRGHHMCDICRTSGTHYRCQSGCDYDVCQSCADRARRDTGSYTGPIFPGGRPHSQLATLSDPSSSPIRVRHSEHGAGVLIGYKYAGERTGDTSGGLSSDGYVRIKFDNGGPFGLAGFNVDSREVCFLGGAAMPTGEWTPTHSRHQLRRYRAASVKCKRCSMFGPSTQTGDQECANCGLCSTCCATNGCES